MALSMNPNAIYILEQNPDKIYLKNLLKNENAVHLLEKYKNELYALLYVEPHNYAMSHIYGNPNALHLLFRLDLDKMKEKCKVFLRSWLNMYLNQGG